MARMISETRERYEMVCRMGNPNLHHTVYFELMQTLDWPTLDHLMWINENYPELRTNISYNSFPPATKDERLVDFEIHTASYLYFIQFKDPKIAMHFKLTFS